ncbi:MAG: hypothetical protein AAFV53_15900 [Myxococcota bacterium]
MSGVLLLLSLAAAGPEAGPIGAVDERLPGDATIRRIETHPEFVRYTLLLPDGRELLVELQPNRAAGSGACQSDTVTLTPRWELLNEYFEQEDQPPYVQALCERLGAQQDIVEAIPFSTPTGIPAPGVLPDRFTERLVPLFLAMFGLVCALSLRAVPPSSMRAPVLIGVVSVVLHAVFSRLGLAATGRWQALALALQRHPNDPLHGGGMAVLYGPFVGMPAACSILHLLNTALCASLVFAIGRLLWPERRRVAWLAGGAMTIGALLIKHTPTAMAAIPATALQCLSILAVVWFVRAEHPIAPVLAGMAAGAALLFLPQALVFLGVPLLLLAILRWKLLLAGRALFGLLGVAAFIRLRPMGLSDVLPDVRASSLDLPALTEPVAVLGLFAALAVIGILTDRSRGAVGLVVWWGASVVSLVWSGGALDATSIPPLALLAGVGATWTLRRLGAG